MELEKLLREIMLLPHKDKKIILTMLNAEEMHAAEGFFHPAALTNTPEWKEMHHRAIEVVREEKTCLIHFDDHLKSFS